MFSLKPCDPPPSRLRLRVFVCMSCLFERSNRFGMVLQAVKGRQLRHNVERALTAGRGQDFPRSRQRWTHEGKARNAEGRNYGRTHGELKSQHPRKQGIKRSESRERLPLPIEDATSSRPADVHHAVRLFSTQLENVFNLPFSRVGDRALSVAQELRGGNVLSLPEGADYLHPALLGQQHSIECGRH